MESETRSEYVLYATWTSKALLGCLNMRKSMSFLKNIYNDANVGDH